MSYGHQVRDWGPNESLLMRLPSKSLWVIDRRSSRLDSSMRATVARRDHEPEASYGEVGISDLAELH